MRRLLIIGASTLLLIVLALGLILVAPRVLQPIVGPLRSTLLRVVTSTVTKSLHGSLEIGALQGSLLSNPTLHHIVLRDADGTPIIQLDELRLRYALMPLLRQRLRIEEITLIRPQLSLIQLPNGTLNISQLAPSTPSTTEPKPAHSEAGLPLEIELTNLQIRDGHLSLDLPSLAGIQTVDHLQVQLSGNLTDQTIQIALHQFEAQTQPAKVNLRTIQGQFQRQGTDSRFDDLRIETDQSRIHVTGAMPSQTQPADLVVNIAPLDVSEIGRVLADNTLQGDIRLSLTATGPPEDIQVESHLQAAAGSLDLTGQFNLASPAPTYQGTVDIAKLDVAAVVQRDALQSDLNLHISLNGTGMTLETLEAKMQMAIRPSHLGDIVLRQSEVDIEATHQRLQVHTLNLNTSVANLAVDGVLDLAGRSDLRYELGAKLHDLKPLLGAQNLSGTVYLQGTAQGLWPNLAAQGTLKARQMHYQAHRLQGLDLSYQASQLGTQPHATAEMVLQHAEIGATPIARIALQATYDDNISESQVQFSTQLRQSAQYRVELGGTLRLSDDRGQHVHLTECDIHLADRTWRAPQPIDLTVKNSHVQINAFHLAHDDESITFSGGLAGTQLDNLRLRISQLDLDFVRQRLALPALVSGRLTLDTALTGTFDTPKLHTALRLQTLAKRLNHQPFDHLQATLDYANQQLTSTVRLHQQKRNAVELNLALPLDLAFTNLPTSDRLKPDPVALRVTLNQLDLAALGRALPTLPALDGTLVGALSLQGTYAQLHLKTQLALQKVGLGSSIDHLNTALQLAGTIVMADSVPALGKAFSEDKLNATLRDLTLRADHLTCRLPGQAAPANRVEAKKLLLRADGKWRSGSLDATLHTLQLQAQALGLPPTHIEMAGTLTPKQVALSHLHIALPNSEMRADGQLMRADQAVQFKIDIPRLDLTEFSPGLPPTLPSAVQGTITLQGYLSEPEVKARLRYAGARITAKTTAQLKNPRPRYTADVTISGLDVAQFDPKLNGTLSTQATLSGTGFAETDRDAQLEVKMTSTAFSLAPDLTAHLQATVQGAAWRLKDLKLTSAPIALDAKGSLAKSKIAALTYKITFDDLTPIRDYLGLDLETKGQLTGELSGSLDALHAQASLQLNDWRYTAFEGQGIRADITATGLPAKPEATLKSQIVGLQGPALPEGTWQLNGQYRDNRGTFALTATEGALQQTALVGHAVIREDLQLTLETLRLQRQDWMWSNPTPIQVVRDAHGQLSVKSFQLRNGDEDIQLQAHLMPNGPITGNIRINNLQIAPTIHAIAPDTAVPSGRVNLNMDINGTIQNPTVNGVLKLDALEWQGNGVGRIESKIDLANNRLQNDLRWFDHDTALLRANGSLGLGSSGKFDMQLNASEFDLGRLPSYSQAVLQSAGALNLALRLSGTLQQPQVHGAITLRDGALQLAATGESYTDIQTQLQFTGNRLTLQELHLGSKTGSLDISGWLQTAGLALDQLDITLKARDFTAMNTAAIHTRLSADLSTKGSQQDLVVDGNITIQEATIRTGGLLGGGPAAVKPEQLTVEGVYGPGINAQETSPTNQKRAQKPQLLPFLRAHVTLDIPKNVWVRDQGIAIELRGKLDAQKQLNAPLILSGDIETVRGFATFYGKKFELQNGRVTFTGTPEINPILNVTTKYRVAGYDVFIHVEGNGQTPTLTMRSAPTALEQADIVSLLLFGRTSDRLTASEGSSLSSKAKNAAAGVAAGAAAEAIGKEVGLDTVEVELGDDPSQARIGAGKYITQDIFLSYERQLGEQGGNTYGVEYSLNRNWMLKGTKSDIGETALDVLWRLDY